jgi:hypothetical protein
LLENCFEPDGKGGWPPISTWIRMLLYLKNTRPYFSYSMSILSRFMQEPRENHWNSTKWLVRYIQGTKDFGLLYKKNKIFAFVRYSEADVAKQLSPSILRDSFPCTL